MRLFLIFMIATGTLLSGCGTVNPAVSALENKAGTDYMGAKANIQQADDMKLRLWIDGACAVNIGALQRAISTSGNPAIANAIFTACPVPAVGVTSTSTTGTMQVQTFNLPPIVRDTPVVTPLPEAVPVTSPSIPAPAAQAPKKAARKPLAVGQPLLPTKPQAPAASTPAPTPAALSQPVVTPPQSLLPPSALPGQ